MPDLDLIELGKWIISFAVNERLGDPNLLLKNCNSVVLFPGNASLLVTVFTAKELSPMSFTKSKIMLLLSAISAL